MKKYIRYLIVLLGTLTTTLALSFWVVIKADGNLQIQWIPEGEWIVFSCGIFTLDNPESSLYITRTDGSQLQRITPTDYVATSPSWSPDGNSIAFLSNNKIYKIELKNGQVEEILDASVLTTAPFEKLESLDWSPDGVSIVFNTSSLDSGRIYSVEADGENPHVILQQDGFLATPRWSPDSQLIAYSLLPTNSNSGIYTISLTKEETNQILAYEQVLGQYDWSPDGAKLIIALTDNQPSRLYYLDLVSLELTPVDLDFSAKSPTWSPRGEWIAFSAFRGDTVGGFQIFISRRDGSELKRLTELTDNPQWYDFDA